MTTALATRSLTRFRRLVPAPGRVRTTSTLPRIERLLYMCEAAQTKERRGEAAAQYHAHCRGRAHNDTPALVGVHDPDGRFRAGRHVCTCPCHGRNRVVPPVPVLLATLRRSAVTASPARVPLPSHVPVRAGSIPHREGNA